MMKTIIIPKTAKEKCPRLRAGARHEHCPEMLKIWTPGSEGTKQLLTRIAELVQNKDVRELSRCACSHADEVGIAAIDALNEIGAVKEVKEMATWLNCPMLRSTALQHIIESGDAGKIASIMETCPFPDTPIDAFEALSGIIGKVQEPYPLLAFAKRTNDAEAGGAAVESLKTLVAARELEQVAYHSNKVDVGIAAVKALFELRENGHLMNVLTRGNVIPGAKKEVRIAAAGALVELGHQDEVLKRMGLGMLRFIEATCKDGNTPEMMEFLNQHLGITGASGS